MYSCIKILIYLIPTFVFSHFCTYNPKRCFYLINDIYSELHLSHTHIFIHTHICNSDLYVFKDSVTLYEVKIYAFNI